MILLNRRGHKTAKLLTIMLSNNDILKKLRVALKLRNDDIIEILGLVDFKISKGALGDLFRKPDHPSYVEAGDQILRNFLNGLIIYKRGRKPETNAKRAIADAPRKIKPKHKRLKFDKKKEI